ncbi:leucine-rich repeat domain-containing protein [Aquimarina sediminis]|uniref:hypothetical protein n=1 Tax=Aquimarina sediminis TaxID=2070536 RepID=UPI000CA00C3E|nr:hypothetical protein [Aquimarina sediminis]
MKKLLLFCFLGGILFNCSSDDDSNIQYTIIPDPKFELALSQYDDISNDGKVPTNEINRLKTLDLSSKGITSLTGIKHFTELNVLICANNLLTKIDISSNQKIKELDLSNNPIISIDVSKNTGLKKITCSKTSINVLDLKNNNQLLSLVALNNNKLTSIDLRNNANSFLSEMHVNSNTLLRCIAVDDTNAPILSSWSKDNSARYIADDCNNLPPFDYTKIVDPNFEIALSQYDDIPNDNQVPTQLINTLTSLFIADKKIEDLTGIEDFVALKFLVCSQNKIKRLNLSKNINLQELQCGNNLLEHLNLGSISSNLHLIHTKPNPNLSCIQVDNVEEALSKSMNNTIPWVIESHTIFSEDCSTPVTYTSIPDLNFEKKLANYDNIPEDGKIPMHYAKLITNLIIGADGISQTGISEYTGIESFINLKHFETYRNFNLKKLDLSNNTNLEKLVCYSNPQLVIVNINNNSNLTELQIDSDNNMLCVQVDNVTDANNNVDWSIPSTATYSTNCL